MPSRCILKIFYEPELDRVSWKFGDMPLSSFQMIGILHTVQNELDQEMTKGDVKHGEQ